MRSSILTFALVVVLSFAAVAANLGIIEGNVVAADDRPVAGAKVQLLTRDGRRLDEHVTDDAGHFEFEQVPFGMYRLKATGPGGLTQEEDVRVASGEVVVLSLSLRPAAEEQVTVSGRRPLAPAPAKVSASVSTVDRQQIEELPRGDTQSVNEILATQPGFVYDAMGNLFARGNHANIQYQLDGVPLPDSASGLFGGFLSPKLIDSMEVLTGGLGVEYGERLAAVVNLNSRRPPEEGEGQIELQGGSYSTVSPSLLYGKQMGPWSVLAGGSYRTTNRALDPAVPDLIQHAGGDEERAFLKVEYGVSDQTRVTLLGAFAHNFYRIPIDTSVGPLDPSLPNGGRNPDQYGNPPAPFFPSNTDQTENERDGFALLSIRHDFDPRASLRVALSYRHSYGFLFGDAQRTLGPTQDPCSTDAAGNTTCATTSDVARTADHLVAYGEQLWRAGEDHVIKLGGQVDQLIGKTEYTAYTRSDALQGPDPALTVSGRDTSHATTGGVYLEDRATFGPLVVTGGVRLDFQRVSFVGNPETASDVGFGPRVGIAYSLGSATVAHAFAGLLWQPPPVLDAAAAARILGLIPPGTTVSYDLKPEKDRYAEVGIESRVIPELTLKLTAWGKLVDDQLDDVGVGGTNLVSPYNFREGRAGGIEIGGILVLGRRFRAFANGTLQKAMGRGIETAQFLFSPDDLANNGWQFLDHDQRWKASAGVTFKESGWRLSSLFEYGSGLRTGPANNQHVPGHVRVDLGAGYEFHGLPMRPALAVDLVNLFDARYAYRINNGFNGSHWAPGRSIFARVSANF
jgi:TonB-dependent receptor-like protein/carboxypeptidase family protein